MLPREVEAFADRRARDVATPLEERLRRAEASADDVAPRLAELEARAASTSDVEARLAEAERQRDVQATKLSDLERALGDDSSRVAELEEAVSLANERARSAQIESDAAVDELADLEDRLFKAEAALKASPPETRAGAATTSPADLGADPAIMEALLSERDMLKAQILDLDAASRRRAAGDAAARELEARLENAAKEREALRDETAAASAEREALRESLRSLAADADRHREAVESHKGRANAAEAAFAAAGAASEQAAANLRKEHEEARAVYGLAERRSASPSVSLRTFEKGPPQ